FAARDTQFAFTVANGVLRAPPVKLENKAATLTANIAADLGATTASAKGSVAYKPGDEALVGSEPVMNFDVEGPLDAVGRTFDSQPLAQFLTQRALEKEQRRVEDMQAVLLEKQRLRREVRYYAALQDAREKAAQERRRLEEMRVKAEVEARAKAAAEAQAKADEEAARIAARAKAQEAARAEAARAEALQKVKPDAPAGAGQGSQVERAPLPPANEVAPVPAQPAVKPNVFSIDNLLKSLDGG
ncbi:MAG TPA: AsmA protein, partial [Mesorhizobium sp.]